MSIINWTKRAISLLTANNTWTGTNNFKTTTLQQETTANEAKITEGWVTENLTLSTGAATTDTTIDIPAYSILKALAYRVTTTITTAANYSIGDPTTSDRFLTGSTNLTAGNTGFGIDFMEANKVLSAQGPVQGASTAKIRVTCNATPGAGAIRLTLFYTTFTPPTS